MGLLTVSRFHSLGSLFRDMMCLPIHQLGYHIYPLYFSDIFFYQLFSSFFLFLNIFEDKIKLKNTKTQKCGVTEHNNKNNNTAINKKSKLELPKTKFIISYQIIHIKDKKFLMTTITTGVCAVVFV